MSDLSKPDIKLFQQSLNEIGVLQDNVNMFQGDVVYTQPLFLMPGCRDSDSLACEVSATYNSGFAKNHNINNADAPTSILGFGWSMPISEIRLTSGASLASDTQTYSLHLDGFETDLVQESQPVFLFAVSGHPKLDVLVQEFLNYGFVLSKKINTTTISADSYILTDDEEEIEFLCQKKGKDTWVYTGGESYQTVKYKFWRINYYPRFQRWAIIREDGSQLSFGGGVKKVKNRNFNESIGNSISWKVCWQSSRGLWTGSSIRSAGQKQFAVAWRLRKMYGRYGEGCLFSYNEFPRNSEDGLIDGVEQLVSPNGLPYTKASYLTCVTDLYGRTATFEYGEKEWNINMQEYSDPHKLKPDMIPNGYQECYETKYLEKITVKDSSGIEQFKFNFKYELCNFIGQSPDTVKRCLVSYEIDINENWTQQGHQFDYYCADEQGNTGAIKSITWPTGGTVSYEYEKRILGKCNRNITFAPPNCIRDAVPFCCFGSDYAVIIWNNSLEGVMSLQIASWDGHWRVWTPNPDNAVFVKETAGINTADINVLAADEFIALSYNSGGYKKLYLLKRNLLLVGQWDVVSSDTGFKPFKKWSLNQGTISIASGANFFVVTQAEDLSRKYSYELFTYHWLKKEWLSEFQIENNRPIVTASSDCFILFFPSTGEVKSFYLTKKLEWIKSSCNIGVSNLNTNAIQVAVNGYIGAISQRVTIGNNNRFKLHILHWNEEGKINVYKETFDLTDRNNNSWTPILTDNSSICVSGNMLRYDGLEWLPPKNLVPTNSTIAEFRYDYAPDLGLIVVTNDGCPFAQIVSYDPMTAWSEPHKIPLKYPENFRDGSLAPHIGNFDCVTIGEGYYKKGAGQGWQDCEITSLEKLLNEKNATGFLHVDTSTFSNQYPRFIVSSVRIPSSNAADFAVSVFVIKNGKPERHSVALKGERLSYPNEWSGNRKGIFPFGGNMFITYPSNYTNFINAKEFTLYHYAKEGVAGTVDDWAVSSAVINNGMQKSIKARYKQDEKSATVSKDGEIAKYYQTSLLLGENDGIANEMQFIYLNGFETDGSNTPYTQLLDGCLYKTVHCRNNTVISEETTNWDYSTKREIAIGWSNNNETLWSEANLYGAYVLEKSALSNRHGIINKELSTYIETKDGEALFLLPHQHAVEVSTAGGVKTDITKFEYLYKQSNHAVAQNMLVDQITERNYFDGFLTEEISIIYSLWKANNNAKVLDHSIIRSRIHEKGNNGAILDKWRVIENVTARHPQTGQIIESSNGMGIPSLTLYSSKYNLKIAEFFGAYEGECAFTAFFEYDKNSGFSIQNQKAQYVNDAIFGRRSLSLNKGMTLTATVKPQKRTHYIFAVRYKSIHDNCSVEVGGDVVKRLMLKSSNNQWRYQIEKINISNTENISLKVKNNGESPIVLDSVLFMPDEALFESAYFNTQTLSLDSTMELSGSVTQKIYDLLQKEIGEVLPEGRLGHLELNIYKTKGILAKYHQPNHSIALSSAGDSFTTVFRNGNEWQNHWKPDDTNFWDVIDGKLCNKHTGSGGKTLTWKGDTQGKYGVALYLQFSYSSSKPSKVSLCFGKEQNIIWNPKGWSWNKNTPLVSGKGTLAKHWLLILKDNLVLFYADGEIVFSQPQKTDITSPFVVDFGNNSVEVHVIVTAFDPRVLVCYKDNVNNERQLHILDENRSLIKENVYDNIGRNVLTTRTAALDFGADNPMIWKQGFIEIDKFLCPTNIDGKASGDIAQYYKEDSGYPFFREIYESLEGEHVLESGKAGKERAIIADRSKSGSTKSRYFSKTTPFSVLAKEVKTADNNTYANYQDNIGRHIRTEIKDMNEKLVSQTKATYGYKYQNNVGVQEVDILLPKTHIKPDGSKYAITSLINSMGEIVEYTDNDIGTTECIYDANGNLRFTRRQDSMEGFWYNCFDTADRLIQEGFIYQKWQYNHLNEKANDYTFPLNEKEVMVGRCFAYGDNPQKPYDLNKLVEVITFNYIELETEPIRVIENWSYDRKGQVIYASQKILGLEESHESKHDLKVFYTYNETGELSSIKHKNDGKEVTYLYQYDDLGHIVSINSPNVKRDVVEYKWTPESRLKKQIRGDVITTLEYDSNGKITEHKVSAGDDTIFHREYEYKINDLVESISDKNANTKSEFDYDALYQLVSFSRDDLVSKTTLEYDANGNALKSKHNNNVAMDFTLSKGTNQLDTITISQLTHEFEYTKDGFPSTWRGIKVQCCNILGKTNKLSKDSHTLQIIRGSSGKVVMTIKENKDSKVYFYGAGILPILVMENSVLEKNVFNYCAWSEAGLDAVLRHESEYGNPLILYPIYDNLGTVWKVTDTKGSVKMAFDYNPFGQVISISGDVEGWPFMYQGKTYYEDYALYDFSSRFYDPLLMRYLEPDPAHQFASPYNFCGNNPLSMHDPSGLFCAWAVAGFSALSGAAIALGIVLTVATAGATAPLLAGKVATSIGGKAVAIAAGIGINAGMTAISGALTSSGIEGATYLGTTPSDKRSASGFGNRFGMAALTGGATGAVSGFAFGAVSSLASLPLKFVSKKIESKLIYALVKIATKVGSKATTGAFIKPANKCLASAIEGKCISLSDMLVKAVKGIVYGVLAGTIDGIAGGVLKSDKDKNIEGFFELYKDELFGATSIADNKSIIAKTVSTNLISCSTYAFVSISSGVAGSYIAKEFK